MEIEPENPGNLPEKKKHWENFVVGLREVLYDYCKPIKSCVNFILDGGREMRKTGWSFLIICCILTWALLRWGEHEIRKHFDDVASLFKIESKTVPATSFEASVSSIPVAQPETSRHDLAFVGLTNSIDPLAADEQKKFDDDQNMYVNDSKRLGGDATTFYNQGKFHTAIQIYKRAEYLGLTNPGDDWRPTRPCYALALLKTDQIDEFNHQANQILADVTEAVSDKVSGKPSILALMFIQQKSLDATFWRNFGSLKDSAPESQRDTINKLKTQLLKQQKRLSN